MTKVALKRNFMPSVLCWLYGPDEQDAALGIEAFGIRIAGIGMKMRRRPYFSLVKR